jgi:hypothetical protein
MSTRKNEWGLAPSSSTDLGELPSTGSGPEYVDDSRAVPVSVRTGTDTTRRRGEVCLSPG